VSAGGRILKGRESAYGKDLRGFLRFRTGEGEKVLVKVGISAVSIAGARRNLEAEVPGWNFDQVKERADSLWERELERIVVHGGSRERRKVFYTALYHAFLCPNLYTDIDGRYRGMDGRVHTTSGYSHYTVFSLWDTYRALHPLFTIVQRDLTVDLIKTMLNCYRQGGRLPVWELAANETDCMIGYHSVPVIVDAYIKGIRSFDEGLALEAMKSSAGRDHFGLKSYRENRFIPSGEYGESVSRTLEYAYDDWCIARMAKELGRVDDYKEFTERAQFYRNLFDRSTGFMRARRNGGWITPFDPAEVNFNYTEANSWQYSFYVPQDVGGLIELHGGVENFRAKLDRLFSESPVTGGLDLPDVSGMKGQYAHGNEPSHHIAWLYSYLGDPSRTGQLVREIAGEMYSARPDGLCGNEDCGQMSAWYIFSAMGFYPVTPGSDIYALGAPLYEKITVNLEGGGQFTVRADRFSKENLHVQDIFLNGKPISAPYLKHRSIISGGELVFMMGPGPGRVWEPMDTTSRFRELRLTPSPYFCPSKSTFSDSLEITLSCADRNADIYFTTDGSIPSRGNRAAGLYRNPLRIDEDTALKAIAIAEGMISSSPVSALYRKLSGGVSINLKSSYSDMYPAGGDVALIDGMRGGEDFRTGMWQGFQGISLDAVVDLGEIQRIESISTGFLQDQRSWIFMPQKVEYYISEDGEDFTGVASLANSVSPRREGAVIRNFVKSGIGIRGRYLRVFAENIGICPDWHPGRGKRAWIFADEIVVK
ncbi:MAG: glycoside hydrolase family 92 protein, partial [Candidatus Latescibacteria bacterium]|nr:glycoside hydrolase family 92 protein [bacterium]MBD3423276.1 glycoside hydrolase family 92 protein [Candidatus Latescibacterota bacterium]